LLKRLDLRGHRIRSLTSGGLHLSPNLEFVYLRDNLLSTLEGIEILNRVKVLDLSFNDFKGPGFEPLENCKMLQQLYLAGNQITSLASLPQLPNLEVSIRNYKASCSNFVPNNCYQVFILTYLWIAPYFFQLSPFLFPW
jgi:Leucine-rich repeat (LRR) protein